MRGRAERAHFEEGAELFGVFYAGNFRSQFSRARLNGAHNKRNFAADANPLRPRVARGADAFHQIVFAERMVFQRNGNGTFLDRFSYLLNLLFQILDLAAAQRRITQHQTDLSCALLYRFLRFRLFDRRQALPRSPDDTDHVCRRSGKKTPRVIDVHGRNQHAVCTQLFGGFANTF